MVYKDFMKDARFETRDHFLYLLIKGFSNRRIGNVSIVSVDVLIKLLGFTANSQNKLAVKESQERLSDAGILKLYEDLSCIIEVDEIKNSETYFARINDGQYASGYFSKIYFDDIQKLVLMDEKAKPKLFVIYYNIISRMYDSISSDKYTLPNIEDIESETGINRKTISKYIEILKDNKLIYYETMRLSKEKTKNVYGRWEDKDVVKEVAQRGYGKRDDAY
jgi:hypothetical protein